MSRRGDMMIAQGMRSTALGCGLPMIFSSLSLSGLARQRRAKPETEKEGVGVGGVLPRAAAAAAWPWATVVLPPAGRGQVNNKGSANLMRRLGCMRDEELKCGPHPGPPIRREREAIGRVRASLGSPVRFRRSNISVGCVQGGRPKFTTRHLLSLKETETPAAPRRRTPLPAPLALASWTAPQGFGEAALWVALAYVHQAAPCLSIIRRAPPNDPGQARRPNGARVQTEARGWRCLHLAGWASLRDLSWARPDGAVKLVEQERHIKLRLRGVKLNSLAIREQENECEDIVRLRQVGNLVTDNTLCAARSAG